jgi:DNA-binding protein H-NS
MPKTLTQLQKQIDSLQRKAEELRRTEAAGVIARIKEAIRHYDLTAADLGLGKGGKAAAKKTKKAPVRKATKGKAKFRDETGRTWTGHGRRPQWFIDALAAGKKAEDLRA